jgi:benzoate-CoA ligase family protein
VEPIARAADLPLYYNAVGVLMRNLSARADEPALLSVERSATFGELAAEVQRVANALRRLGLRRDDVVAILAPDSVEWVSAFFGTLAAGGVALGLNTLLKPHELAFQLEDSRARALIAGAALLGPLRGHLSRSFLEHVVVLGQDVQRDERPFGEWIAREPARCEAARTHREDICCLNYTSGTTGEPKGIPHAHKDLPLCAQLWGVNVLGLGPQDRTFSAARLFFTFGTGGGLVFPWYVGASAVLMSGSPRVAGNVLETVQGFRPTILYNAPTGYALALALPDLTERYDLSSLRLCVSAGEALPAALWHAWKARTGLDIIDGIGSTENWHIFLSNRPGDIRPGSTGKPFHGYEVELVDEEDRPIREAGVVGNLWVKGETAALSYLRRAEQSRRTFRGEWLVTGDKYSRDAEGYYWHAGRADDMLKVGGIWVSPVEVESVLVAHEAVLECAVVGRVDDAGLVKPKALVVPKPGYRPAQDLAARLVAHCREHMAEYKRPRWIEFVDELPRTATGKIQRFRLRGGGPHDSPGAAAAS